MVNCPSLLLSSPSGGLPSAVRWAQLLIGDRLYPGAAVVDATAGNGHDTLFLAQTVGPEGRVWAFDVQEAAVQATRERLAAAQVSWAEVLHAGHEQLLEKVPCEWHGQVQAVMFNLGYLPGSDKTVITQTETTLLALPQALQLLAPRGLLTVAVYPGHEGGKEELSEIENWARGLSPRTYEVQVLRPINSAANPPECWVIWKRG